MPPGLKGTSVERAALAVRAPRSGPRVGLCELVDDHRALAAVELQPLAPGDLGRERVLRAVERARCEPAGDDRMVVDLALGDQAVVERAHGRQLAEQPAQQVEGVGAGVDDRAAPRPAAGPSRALVSRRRCTSLPEMNVRAPGGAHRARPSAAARSTATYAATKRVFSATPSVSRFSRACSIRLRHWSELQRERLLDEHVAARRRRARAVAEMHVVGEREVDRRDLRVLQQVAKRV